MVGPGALKPKVGDGIKSRRPLSAPVLHSFILLFFFFVLCLLLHLYWCVYNNNNNIIMIWCGSVMCKPVLGVVILQHKAVLCG